jgi:hypothetical protein
VDAKRAASESRERLVRAGAGLGTALAGRASAARERLEHAGPGLKTAWAVRAEDGRVRYFLAGLGLGLLAGSLTGSQFGFLPATGRVSETVYRAGWPVPRAALAGIAAGLCLSAIALISRWADGRNWESRRRRVSARLRARAAEDPVFRQHLKADPRGAFDHELRSKTRVPPGFEVTVVEKTPAHWYVVLPPPGAKKPGALAVRVEDGRIDYATTGFGVGLIAGSLLSIASDNMQWVHFTGFRWAPLASLGLVWGLGLFVMSLGSQSRTGRDWSWERRPMPAVRWLVTKAVKDPKVRKELKAHPRRVFDREVGPRLRGPTPDDFEITVLEETPTHEYIVL